MKCTVTLHPKRRDVLMILLDDELIQEVHTTIVGKQFKVAEKVESREELLIHLNQEIEAGARRYALFRLSKAAMSIRSLRRILQERLISDRLCEEIIAYGIRLGFLDDELYAEQIMRRKKRTLAGRGAIKWACLQKGIDPELADAAYTASTTQQEEHEAIRAFAKKRASRPQTPEERKKLIAALMRRGFSYGIIQEALKL